MPQNALHMRAGAILRASPDRSRKGSARTRNNSAFSTFVDAVCTQIGASVEMPKEILLKSIYQIVPREPRGADGILAQNSSGRGGISLRIFASRSMRHFLPKPSRLDALKRPVF